MIICDKCGSKHTATNHVDPYTIKMQDARGPKISDFEAFSHSPELCKRCRNQLATVLTATIHQFFAEAK
jgi:hypothetical protein